MSQSVKQCMTEDLFPHIMANVVDTQNEHLYLHAPVLNKTSRLSSARIFVRLYIIDCYLYIVYMYQWQNQQVLPFVPGWIVPGSIRSLKVTRKAIMLCSMALPSKLCAALHGQSYVCSMCDCNPCRSLDLSVLAEILSGVVSNHGTGPPKELQCQL